MKKFLLMAAIAWLLPMSLFADQQRTPAWQVSISTNGLTIAPFVYTNDNVRMTNTLQGFIEALDAYVSGGATADDRLDALELEVTNKFTYVLAADAALSNAISSLTMIMYNLAQAGSNDVDALGLALTNLIYAVGAGGSNDVDALGLASTNMFNSPTLLKARGVGTHGYYRTNGQTAVMPTNYTTLISSRYVTNTTLVTFWCYINDWNKASGNAGLFCSVQVSPNNTWTPGAYTEIHNVSTFADYSIFGANSALIPGTISFVVPAASYWRIACSWTDWSGDPSSDAYISYAYTEFW